MRKTLYFIFRSVDLEKCYIKMKDVNMSYCSSVYNAKSIKDEIFTRLKFQKPKKLLKDVHALKNFTLEVNEGDRIGVIGNNGSGKSTLLKTIGGIYPIESGMIETRGKIRALFEISLGFEMESTGRENILYRGLLLGALPQEIKAKTEQIIEFADIGEFIDFPVKSYSTGMLVRLAFAVSTCVTGEILLLDEIIGAGDATFMAKAKKRMLNVMDESKLMVFVSHDMTTIQEVCNRVILMKNGQIAAQGKPEEIIKIYLEGEY